jgi:hypothetical protein
VRGSAGRIVTGAGGHGRGRSFRRLAFFAELLRSFYQRPVAWLALFVSSAFLTYGGGAVMFWFHAIVRGEAGPAIGNVHHWLLDSTLGFIALTPVLAAILPVALWRTGGGRGPGELVRVRVYGAVVAVVFTAFTGPGPLLHNALAGAGTPLARFATRVFGEDMAVAHTVHGHAPSPLTEGLLQLGVGLPVYLTCIWLALHLTRLMVRATRGRRPVPADSAARVDVLTSP